MTFLKPNPQKCHSCIFKSPEDGGLELDPDQFEKIYKYVLQGRSHRCHNHQNRCCRGARDIHLMVFYRMNLIPEPTDAALEAANDAYLESKKHDHD